MIDGVQVTMIAAVAANGVIGRANTIPWRIPSDLQHFKRMTLDKPIVMGRKQFESVGRPLPRRTNIIVSRQPDFQPEGVIVIDNLEHALARAADLAKADNGDEIVVVGGGEIYKAAMDHADRLIISRVMATPLGDVHFPEIAESQWRRVADIGAEPLETDDFAYTIEVYQRRISAAH